MAELGVGRPDVANAYHNPAYANSGWRFTVPASSLALGKHSVGAVATDSLGLSTTLQLVSITVN
jgi:hypothetical protein